MPRSTSRTLMLVAALVGAAALCARADQPQTPAEQFQELAREYQSASSSGRVLSDEERLRFVGLVYKRRHKLALKLVELAERDPRDPVAAEALMQAVWQVNTTPWPVDLVGHDAATPKAVAILTRDHIQNPKLGTVCQRMSSGFCKEYETFLRSVLEKSAHRDVQGQACLALGHFLCNRLQRLDLCAEQPALGKEFADLFGKDYLDALERQDRAQVSHEAEALFERAAGQYGDVKLADGSAVGVRASAELFELRHLAVGKEAPEIEGSDQDGKQFKLSDFRGRVVLLDFWSEY